MTGRWEPRAREAAGAALAADPRELDVVALAVRPTRETYACAANGGPRVIAKCYGDARVAAASHRALGRVGGDHGLVRVPRSLRYDAARGVIVQDEIVGASYLPLLEGDAAPDAVRRAARALAGLHALPGRPAARRDRAVIAAEARGALPAVPASARDLADAAFAWAQRSLRAVPVTPDVPCHGDFGWAQLIDCGGAVGVVDFDRAVMAEAAFDVGNLVAQLVRRRGATGVALAAPLIEAYERASGRAVGELALPYAALVLVRKLGRLRPHNRPQLAAALSALGAGRYGG